MLYVLGLALMSAALLIVHFASRAVNRPTTPGWLRAAALGNTIALLATVVFASGLASLLQAAFQRGDALGFAISGAMIVLPFAGLWLLARVRPAETAPAAEETSDLPPTTGGRPRRGRPDPRPAEAGGRAAAARSKAG